MILTCPQCSSQFKFPADQLGDEGRHVKCSDCGEVWHQLPDPEELSEAAPVEEDVVEEAASEEGEQGADDFEDIPEGVKPAPDDDAPEGENAETDEGSGGFSVAGVKAMILASFPHSLIAAAAIFVVILIVLLALSSPMKKIFPSMRAFYGTFGMVGAVPGEGLVFDRLEAKIEAHDGYDTLSLQGKIVNLTAKDTAVPYIEAVIKDEHGEAIDHLVVDPSAKMVEKEGVLDFEAQHELSHDGGVDVTLRFVLSAERPAKTALEDDGNTPAPPADD